MNFYSTYISERSKILLNEVLDSTFISAGRMADQLEKEFNSELNLINPVTLNSGTSALHLALVLSGVGPGDEVILPAQTFIATGHVILMVGAKPVFADIQVETGNIDPISVRRKITDKTKAIIPVHWGGYPCDLDELNEIAKEYNLAVIEDAAHALGSEYHGRPIGSISRFTAFSLQAIKHLTAGDGGILCCLNIDDLYQAKRRRWFDIDRENSIADILGERIYDAVNVGYKYHLNDLAASIALGNLYDFDKIIERYRQIGNYYRSELDNVPGIELLKYKSDRKSSFWLFTILVDNRFEFITSLKSKKIPTSVVHLRIDKNSVFGGLREDLINQAYFDANQVSIPINESLTDEDVEWVVKSIKTGW